MNEYRVKPAAHPLEIRVEVPGSKSITNRALLLAAMAEGKSVLQGILLSDDSEVFLQALDALGFPITLDREKRTVCIEGQGGRIPQKRAKIFVGSAGTAARFLTAFLAMSDGVYEVDATEQMKKRPMRELFDALKDLGAEFTFHGAQDTFPYTVTGIGTKITEKRRAKVALNIDRSSQFLSALFLTVPLRFESLTVTLTGTRSARSYVEMTEQMMKQFGHTGVIRHGENCYEIMPGAYRAQAYLVEPDVSAACYFYAMAAVTGGTAAVAYMRRDSLQGDMKFIEVLEKMGCTVSWTGGELLLKGPAGGRLKGVTASFADFSDQTLTMAAIAPYADSPTTVQGIAHIRGQESDRAAVICTELARLGISCEQGQDSLTIYPGAVHGGRVKTYEDHRVAMAFALTGLRTQGVIIENPDCCKKTFPEYFMVFERCVRENATL